MHFIHHRSSAPDEIEFKLRVLRLCAAVDLWSSGFRRAERALGMTGAPYRRQALRWQIAALRFKSALLRWAELDGKAGFDPKQPRGLDGRWSGGSGSPGIGHNQGPPLEQPPRIPKTAPKTTQARNAFVKSAARWLLKATLRQATGPVGLFAAGLEAASWLQGDQARIDSYTDQPKSLEELKQAVATPRWGYDIHHIVEQTSAIRDGFPASLVHGPDNLVRIPTLKHWELNGRYTRPNEDFGGLTPRQYLQGKDWNERTRIGLQGLVKIGVLRP